VVTFFTCLSVPDCGLKTFRNTEKISRHSLEEVHNGGLFLCVNILWKIHTQPITKTFAVYLENVIPDPG
jgi:hypothetical protein